MSGNLASFAIHVDEIDRARAFYEAGPGSTGSKPLLRVDDVDVGAAAVEANGGQITLARSVIPTVGALVRFLDPEGNDIGAMKYETTPHT